MIYFVAALATICAAHGILKKNTYIVIGAYYASAGYLRFGLPQSQSHINWGWVVIGFAFLFFGAAFLVTRSQLNKANRVVVSSE